MAKVERLMEAVREVLLREWDPIGVAHFPECFDEYDRYARTICRYLDEGIDEFKLSAYLAQVQTVGMGLTRADEARDTLVARRLLALSAYRLSMNLPDHMERGHDNPRRPWSVAWHTDG